MMEQNSYAVQENANDPRWRQWFAVAGDLDDFIFYDGTEDAYEHKYISER